MRHNPAAGAVVIMAHEPSKCTAWLRRADRARLPSLRDRAADLVAASESRDGRPRGEINGLSAQAARFPNYRDLTGFDFASSEVNEALARQLRRCQFLEDAHNVVLVGGPGRPAHPLRSRHPRRAWLSAVQRLRRSAALPSAEQLYERASVIITTNLSFGEWATVFGEDDDRSTRSSHPPMSHPRNRKRQLPFQQQLGESRQTRKGETSKLDERLTPKPPSRRVSSQWKSRVTSQRKSTP
jgi:hypothetical protein